MDLWANLTPFSLAAALAARAGAPRARGCRRGCRRGCHRGAGGRGASGVPGRPLVGVAAGPGCGWRGGLPRGWAGRDLTPFPRHGPTAPLTGPPGYFDQATPDGMFAFIVISNTAEVREEMSLASRRVRQPPPRPDAPPCGRHLPRTLSGHLIEAAMPPRRRRQMRRLTRGWGRRRSRRCRAGRWSGRRPWFRRRTAGGRCRPTWAG